MTPSPAPRNARHAAPRHPGGLWNPGSSQGLVQARGEVWLGATANDTAAHLDRTLLGFQHGPAILETLRRRDRRA